MCSLMILQHEKRPFSTENHSALGTRLLPSSSYYSLRVTTIGTSNSTGQLSIFEFIWMESYSLCSVLADFFHTTLCLWDSSVCVKHIYSHCWVVFRCVSRPQFMFYSFCCWTFGLFSARVYCEHHCACILLDTDKQLCVVHTWDMNCQVMEYVCVQLQ